MRLAYLLLAHANPIHLSRLSRTLAAPGAAQFVHIDLKSDLERFSFPREVDVRLSRQRVPVYWGEYSMVEAALLLMEQAVSAAECFDYCVLLSGADYPLRSGEYIRDYFRRMSGAQFISMAPIPTHEAGLPLSKLNRLAYPSDRRFMKWVAKAGARVGLGERDHRMWLGELRPYGGSTWWALSRHACELTLEFARRQPRVCDYFRHTYSSDEMFFHTVLGNSEELPKVRRSLVYDDWSHGGIHPSVIGPKHLTWFESETKVCFDDAFGPGEILFARKFSDESTETIARIDRMILAKGMDAGA